ncbi:MAG: hypothetical protein QOD77_1837 [Thermoplasmata archaeon]|jgi:hypothetical protein|nr:hypothetical protein [Thermoplasmata archaeon]
MQSTPILSSIATVALALALAVPGAAYHVTPDAFNNQNGLDAQEWGRSPSVYFPLGDPFTDDQPLCITLRAIANFVPDPSLRTTLNALLSLVCKPYYAWNAADAIFAFPVCEAPPAFPDPGHSGFGKLCFMSPGFAGVTCAFVGTGVDQGGSNGFYNPYTGGACAAAPPTMAPMGGPAWFRITMQSTHPATPGSDVQFVASIGGISCPPATALVYDDLFAQTVANGHVTGVPDVEPAPASFGGYTVESVAGPAGLTACGASPMYV